jgi:meromycolic acid enoyl-[acyl-carrier-protein] reductase
VGILEGKTILVAGVTLDTSIGFHVAKIAQAEGATVVVSNFGRAMSLTRRVIKKLDPVPQLFEVDVTNEDHLAGLAAQLGEHLDHLDGLVHSLPSPTRRPRSAGSSSARRGPMSVQRCRSRPIRWPL